MKLVRRYLIALFVVFLHLAAVMRFWSIPENRFWALWSWRNAVGVLIALFLFPLVLTLLAGVVDWVAASRRMPRLKRLVEHVFLVALLSGSLAAVPSLFRYGSPLRTTLIWFVGMVAAGFSFARGWRWPARYARKLCVALSPVVLAAAVWMLSWGGWRGASSAGSSPRTLAEPRTAVFLFVFHGWSLPRSTTNGEVRPELAHLRELCERAVVFRGARSAAADPRQSLPRLLYQRESALIVRGTAAYWESQGKTEQATAGGSLFTLSRERGYSGYMIGWDLPYQRILGDAVDQCRTYGVLAPCDSLAAAVGSAVLRSMKYWTDPVSPWVRSRGYLAWHARSSARLRAEMLRVLADCPGNSFAAFHLPLPAWPFLWSEDGAYRGAASEAPDSRAGYARSLRSLDAWLGQALGQLRTAGKLDGAMIVVTADHAWRQEPEPTLRQGPDWERRVPLIVKLPGQQRGVVIEGEMQTNRLRPLFEAVFAGERDTERLIHLLRQAAAAAPGLTTGRPAGYNPAANPSER